MRERSSPRVETHSALILAAGASSRMGQQKIALPWLRNQRLLEWTFGNLASSGWCPRVVLGPTNFQEFERILPKGAALLNPKPEAGKWTSIATGISALPSETNWILLISADQPRFGALFAQLRQETTHSSAHVILPDHGGRRGHPVVISSQYRQQLSHLERYTDGLRGLMNELRPQTYSVKVENPGQLDWDLNAPEDYLQALAWFEKTRSE